MASDHVLALSHLVAAGLGVAVVTFAGQSLTRRRRLRVQTEDVVPLRQRRLVRLGRRVVRGTARLITAMALAVVTPVGLLCANQRYPLVAPVLAPFEARLAALGHRAAHAQCVPLLAWHIWLVRCAGCHHYSFFREVPAAGGAGIELKALGLNTWHTQACSAVYLSVPAETVTRRAQPPRPTRRRVHPARTVPKMRPTATLPPSQPHHSPTDKTA